MSPAQVLALASGPVIVLLHVIWSVDRHREPFGNVFKYLLVGGATIWPAIVVETLALRAFGDPTSDPAHTPIPLLLVASVIGIGLVEELVKYLGLSFFARRDRHLDERFDWVVYAVTVSLGFALVENVKYVVDFGPEVAMPRALFAVPAHALCGTLMGCRLARAAGAGVGATKQRVLALVEPALWHGVYDFLAFASSRAEEGQLPGSLFDALFGLLVLLHWTRCVNQVRGLLVEGEPLPPVLYPLRGTKYARRAGARSSKPDA
ncbi:MAG: PrsW family intramembrane metalloprotease [Planctomycetes bacterium]|nr:PrsW family intramembrane metalloprotease [Planctomycetota bacterium]